MSSPKAALAAALFLGLLCGPGRGATASDWIALRGHKNILVDMASIEPMRKGRMLPTTGSPDTPNIEYDETTVTIKLNGHQTRYQAICSGGFKFGDTTIGINSNAIGTIPSGAIEALVCPKARR
jgi:hypothetical protein